MWSSAGCSPAVITCETYTCVNILVHTRACCGGVAHAELHVTVAVPVVPFHRPVLDIGMLRGDRPIHTCMYNILCLCLACSFLTLKHTHLHVKSRGAHAAVVLCTVCRLQCNCGLPDQQWSRCTCLCVRPSQSIAVTTMVRFATTCPSLNEEDSNLAAVVFLHCNNRWKAFGAACECSPLRRHWPYSSCTAAGNLAQIQPCKHS